VRILLYSGGLDSYIISKLEPIDKALYFDLNLPYNKVEIKNMEKLDTAFYVLYPFGNGGVGGIGGFELDNKIIPLRNLFFALYASYYGNDVILGATKGDSTHDKDQPFCDMVTKLVQYIYDPPEKAPLSCRENKFKLSIPYREYTKTQMVKMYLAKGLSPDMLLKTRSCYGIANKECGECRSCFRKAVALRNNNIYDARLFETDPFSKTKENLEYAKKVGRSEEIKDIEKSVAKPVTVKRRKRKRIKL